MEILIIAVLFTTSRLTSADNPRALMYRAVMAKGRSLQRSQLRRLERERRVAERLSPTNPS